MPCSARDRGRTHPGAGTDRPVAGRAVDRPNACLHTITFANHVHFFHDVNEIKKGHGHVEELVEHRGGFVGSCDAVG